MSKHTTTIAAAAAAAVLAFGAWMIGKSSDTSTSVAAAPAGAIAPQAGQTPQAGQVPQAGQTPPQGGQAPPGMGTDVSGTTATKVGKVALAAHPGSVERVEQLADGSYVVHVITSSGELHVTVSKALKVTGTQQGGGPPGLQQGRQSQQPSQAPSGTSAQ